MASQHAFLLWKSITEKINGLMRWHKIIKELILSIHFIVSNMKGNCLGSNMHMHHLLIITYFN